MVTVSGNPNPTNPTTKYRCEFGTLFCIYAGSVIVDAPWRRRFTAAFGISVQASPPHIVTRTETYPGWRLVFNEHEYRLLVAADVGFEEIAL